jgi:hypothetical protein
MNPPAGDLYSKKTVQGSFPLDPHCAESMISHISTTDNPTCLPLVKLKRYWRWGSTNPPISGGWLRSSTLLLYDGRIDISRIPSLDDLRGCEAGECVRDGERRACSFRCRDDLIGAAERSTYKLVLAGSRAEPSRATNDIEIVDERVAHIELDHGSVTIAVKVQR